MCRVGPPTGDHGETLCHIALEWFTQIRQPYLFSFYYVLIKIVGRWLPESVSMFASMVVLHMGIWGHRSQIHLQKYEEYSCQSLLFLIKSCITAFSLFNKFTGLLLVENPLVLVQWWCYQISTHSLSSPQLRFSVPWFILRVKIRAGHRVGMQ